MDSNKELWMIFLFVVGCVDYSTGTPSPLEVVKDLPFAVMDALQKSGDNKTLLHQTMNRIFDHDILFLGRMATRVLSDHWHEATKLDRVHFVQLFRQMFYSTYARLFMPIRASKVTRFYPLPDGDYTQIKRAIVKSYLQIRNDRRRSLEYEMHRLGGRWRLVDIRLERESFLEHIKKTLATPLEKGGLRACIQFMKAVLPTAL